MESDGQKTGKARVRDLLIGRLQEAGMTRPRGQAVAQHEAFLGRVAEQLAYMDEENLRTLAETLIDMAQGGVWPSEVLIRQYARALQAPPIQQHRIVSSWLASVEGPLAEAGGYLVELYRFLIRHGRPPLAMDMRLIREQAEANGRQVHLAQDRLRREVVTEEDRAWLAQYRADQAAAQRIVDEGARRRAQSERAAG
ncbi:hypothetical protein [Halodurantibacterium flavum]|uniref:Uncharacterized protein n=1 Tax=Halodurantibacterium flavum TaxID=1382802 RepID=A0ABW4S897_9RHOB